MYNAFFPAEHFFENRFVTFMESEILCSVSSLYDGRILFPVRCHCYCLHHVIPAAKISRKRRQGKWWGLNLESPVDVVFSSGKSIRRRGSTSTVRLIFLEVKVKFKDEVPPKRWASAGQGEEELRN